MRRKLITLLIMLVTILALPVAVSAAEGSTYSDSNFTYRELADGTLSVTGYIGPGGNVVIPASYNPGSGDMQISDIAVSAFYDKQSITGVTIPAGVMTIGQDAFYLCDSLTSITFMPGSKLETIGIAAFRDAGITSVTIPASVVTINQDAFLLSDLSRLTFEPGSNLQTIGQGAFYGTYISEVIIPSSVTTLSKDVFLRCRNLESVKFEPGSNLLAIGESAFFETAIKSITIPASVTSIGRFAFYLSQLEKIVVLSSEVVFDAEYVFYGAPMADGIYGYANSTAQTYAASRGINFYTLLYKVTFDTAVGSEIEPQYTGLVGKESIGEPTGSVYKGYHIDGWYTEQAFTNKVIFPYTPASNVTLFAHWAPITYTIVYNAPDADSGSISSSSHTYDLSAELTLNGFTRDNYMFVGWAENSGGPAVYEDGENVLNLTDQEGAVIQLYAVWIPYVPLISDDDDGVIYTGGRITITPLGEEGVWMYDEQYLSRSGNTFRALKTGTTTVYYITQSSVGYIDITITQAELPQTGQDFTAAYILILISFVCGAGICLYIKKSIISNEK